MGSNTIIGALFQDGTSQVRPLYFNGHHLSHWKVCMEIYTMPYDIKVWRVIEKENLPIPPKKDANGQVIVSTDPLDLDDYTNEQVAVITVNTKAKNLLYNAISGEEYKKISSCETVKEIWDKLEVTYEGTNKVKETRINLLVRDYELFQMKDGESIEEIFFRFNKILGDLKSFGRPIKSGEHRCSKATTAESKNEEEEEGGEQDKNIAMLSQVVTSMMRINRNNRRGKTNFRKGRMRNEADKNDRRCYECGKFGHIQVDCPELKKKLIINIQKKKAFGTWSDEEEYDHEEIANICFMAISENKDSAELRLMAVNNDEEDDSREPCLLADEGTNEVRISLCPNCYELQEFVDIALADIESVVNKLRRIKREKKD
ncbi:uncharacterized protein [Nicotiana tomentosiformis]|uniref:uncharacterized protein n=1 Tax=Nicotiana tomentosiformis TaxID=4098 RepID=UPI00388C99D2